MLKIGLEPNSTPKGTSREGGLQAYKKFVYSLTSQCGNLNNNEVEKLFSKVKLLPRYTSMIRQISTSDHI